MKNFEEKQLEENQQNKIKGGYNGALEYTPVQNGKEHNDTTPNPKP